LSDKSRIRQVQEPQARRGGAVQRDEPYEFNNKCRCDGQVTAMPGDITLGANYRNRRVLSQQVSI
jgi:hypothetical protein